ncbi:uncharacterized protein LOC115231005 [Octopus sinensis]|uniref:Uncharacterized protein LOC115231005 n=1 Tax=Octopus sinensis TaxID=2607531 RepID=A0A6P7TYT5_9MOLL|nr:uncharacterized protein LOC115231005 [Octopus sinensis]
MDHTQYFEWYRRCKSGRTFLKDTEQSGRLASRITPRKVVKIPQLVHEGCVGGINDIADVVDSPERDDLTLNVSRGKVCVDTPIKFRCSWKGGDPPASVTLKYEKYSNTSKEEVEINVKSSKFHQTVKCLGIHIAANVSREKNLTIYYPPDMVEIKADEPFLEGDKGILHCKARNGYPEKYSYRWDPSKKTSQNLTFPQLNRTHNNEVYTCYVSNKCSKRELHKTHWINVECKLKA